MEHRKWSDYHVKYTSFDDLVKREEDKAALEYLNSLPDRWAKAWKIAEDFVQKWTDNVTKD
jgi:hypothetical protein